MLIQRAGVPAVVGVKGDADGRAHFERYAGDGDHRFQRLEHFVHHQLDVVAPGQTRQEHGELIAGQARDGV